MKVLLTDYAWPDLSIEQSLLQQAGHELLVAADGNEPTLINLARQAGAIMTCWAKVTAAVIDACDHCRIVSRLGIGLDNIDVEHCTRLGIPVTNVPEYCVDEVAEHAIGLMMALARRIGFFHLRTKAGEYSLAASGPMYRVAGKTLGIVGFGRIGRALAERTRGLGLQVLAFNRSPIGDTASLGVEQVSMDELLARSDFVSLHVPLTTSTRHLINRESLALMKPTAFLVNTSRGALVDPEALFEAIEVGRLAGAGLDVHDPEPPDLSLPLYCDERVIATPHAAFSSEESLAELREVAVKQVVECLEGKRPHNVVNAQIYKM